MLYTVFTLSINVFNTAFDVNVTMGCYYLYGFTHCKSYSSDHIAIGNLVREICSTHSFIPHFSHSEPEEIGSAAIYLYNSGYVPVSCAKKVYTIIIYPWYIL